MGREALIPQTTMKALAFIAILCGVSGLFFHQANQSLAEMTANDCRAGIQRACDQLAK